MPGIAAVLAAALLLPAATSAQPGVGGVDAATALATLDALLAPPSACAASGLGGDIIVCARRRTDPERYRLPLRADGFDPDGSLESVSRERNGLMEGGGSGAGSCSAAGAGGWTGCFIAQVRHSQQQHGFH